MLSTREIAIAVWTALFLAWGFSVPGVRSAAGGLLRSALSPKLALPVLLAVGWVGASVLVLRAAGLWTPALLKDTALWFTFSGLAAAFSFGRVGEDRSLLREAIVDSAKVTVVIEYITATYTLPLIWELALVPVLTVVAMMDAIAGSKPEYAPAKRLLSGIQIAAGLAILTYAVREAVSDYGALATVGTARSIALVPLLSALFWPFVYLLHLYVGYELVFLRLRLGPAKDSDTLRYARWRLVRHLGLSLGAVRSMVRRSPGELMRVATRRDVDELISGC